MHAILLYQYTQFSPCCVRWFIGKLNAEDAKERLLRPYNKHGSYLIRYSESFPGQYVLSLRDREAVWHYRIKKLEDGTFLLDGEGMYFRTIIELVAEHQKQRHGLPVKLIHHCVMLQQEDDFNETSDTIQKWEIDRRHINLVVKLREGEFSDVWKGIFAGTKQVAIMIRKPQMAQYDFLQVAYLMMKLHHPRLIQLYGLCTKYEPIYIIMEHSQYGSLLNFLQKPEFTSDLDQMSKQVAEGMAYLEEQNCVHRDLAARNVIVGQNLRCKVANFEMARMMGENNSIEINNERRSTYKWTAPEAAIQNKYSIKSDVWSFGIVLYEIFTHGCTPYPGMTDDLVLKMLQCGFRMPRPHGCQEQLYVIMQQCWKENPTYRPTFKTLVTQLLRGNIFDKVFTSEQIFADPATLYYSRPY